MRTVGVMMQVSMRNRRLARDHRNARGAVATRLKVADRHRTAGRRGLEAIDGVLDGCMIDGRARARLEHDSIPGARRRAAIAGEAHRLGGGAVDVEGALDDQLDAVGIAARDEVVGGGKAYLDARLNREGCAALDGRVALDDIGASGERPRGVAEVSAGDIGLGRGARRAQKPEHQYEEGGPICMCKLRRFHRFTPGKNLVITRCRMTGLRELVNYKRKEMTRS